MGLEEVKKDILAGAEKEVARIKADSSSQISQIKERVRESLKEKKKQESEVLRRDRERLQQRKDADNKAAMKEQVLAKKRLLIDDAVTKAKERLKEGKYLPKLLAKARKELNVERVYCSEKLGLKDVTIVNKEIDGLIAENKDGSISIDYSFDTLLNNIKEANLREISEVLFK